MLKARLTPNTVSFIEVDVLDVLRESDAYGLDDEEISSYRRMAEMVNLKTRTITVEKSSDRRIINEFSNMADDLANGLEGDDEMKTFYRLVSKSLATIAWNAAKAADAA
jgi:hypothetical protein